MIDKFVPDMFYQSIYRVDYEKLKNVGIKLIIFDLDNTIATYSESIPRSEAKELIDKLKEMGFNVILMSNSNKSRVLPFRNALEIDSCANAKKPLTSGYKKIMKVYHLDANKIACIGDQLITDIWGANKMGMTSILVNPISKKYRKITYINRFFEKILFKIMDKEELFKKRQMYE